ncbi:LGFP repeat-containing protein [Yinghuangia soli]|uniref:LGFP repeat-containing protein n=1 Tax=Yinghuangia soli TaxID=2908204 RepID=A0AA41PVN0_9ACTN|nr:hypothetical protein [Yinghuangia soli]MCF2526526.1 hypothetical protein [Yinghuangia soli]
MGVRIRRTHQRFGKSIVATGLAGLALVGGLLSATPAAADTEPQQLDAPYDLTISPTPRNGTGPNCGWINKTAVRLTAKIAPRDLNRSFESTLRLQDLTAPGSPWTEYTTDSTYFSTSAVSFQVLTLQDGHTYSWTVQTRVGGEPSAVATGCPFSVDSTTPTFTVSSEDWPSDGGIPRKGVSQTGIFHVTPDPGSEDIYCYEYQFDSPPTPGSDCRLFADASGRLDIQWHPHQAGTHVLNVQAQDRAGNKTKGSYTFTVPASPIDPWAACSTINGHQLCGPLLDLFEQLKRANSNFPSPAGVTANLPDGVGKSVPLTDGSALVWSSASGASFVPAPIWVRVAQLGGVSGWLGYPRENPVGSAQHGYVQDFSGGVLAWSPTSGAHLLFGAIGQSWRDSGGIAGLGYPKDDESDIGDGRGRKQTFEKGILTWGPSNWRPHAVRDAIASAWSAGARWYGAATTDELAAPDGIGRYQVFEKVRFYWTPKTGAQEIHGGILNKWWELGGERGFLGYPTTGEQAIGNGRVSHFERGSIYWSAASGPHELHGGIKARWLELGGPAGLGFPLTDEMVTGDKRGRYVVFERGSIFWTATTGAVEIYGGIGQAWASQGWNSGPLGYPTRGEYGIPGGRRADFEHGYITWTAATGKTQIVVTG